MNVAQEGMRYSRRHNDSTNTAPVFVALLPIMVTQLSLWLKVLAKIWLYTKTSHSTDGNIDH